jgi:hypothetical protein
VAERCPAGRGLTAQRWCGLPSGPRGQQHRRPRQQHRRQRRVRAVPGRLRPPRAATLGTARPQRPVRRPRHWRDGLELSACSSPPASAAPSTHPPSTACTTRPTAAFPRPTRVEAGDLAQRRTGPGPAGSGWQWRWTLTRPASTT